MNNRFFIEQEATSRILQQVASVCAECYRELKEGESIFYDTEGFRYLCEECAMKFAEMQESAEEKRFNADSIEIVEERRDTLF